MSQDRVPETPNLAKTLLYVERQNNLWAAEFLRATLEMVSPESRKFGELVAKLALPIADSDWMDTLEEAGFAPDIIIEARNTIREKRSQSPATAESSF